MLRAVDLFCGAGGSTTGAEQSGRVKVVLAINHWRTAIQSHQDNHPGTRHICARIDHVDPRNDKSLPEFDLLLASPECTHHSIARGAAPVCDQKRATPWHVVIWAEACRPKWIIVENVREFRDWGPIKNGKPTSAGKGETFAAWIQSLRSLGYTVEWNLLNAADFGAATKRIRLFVVARLGGGAIPWPVPTHAGRWRPAHEIIDWSRFCPSIFGRKRPLAEKTLRRIEAGLRKFVGNGAADSFVVKYHGGHDPARDGTERTHATGRPLPTIDTQPRFALTVPFQLKAMGRSPGVTKPITEPVPTIVNHAVVCPVNHGDSGGSRTNPVADPLRTITASKSEALILPFLTKYHGTGGVDSVDDPLSTCTTKPRHGQIQDAWRSAEEVHQQSLWNRGQRGDVISCIVGGGVMGSRLCHENEAPFPEALAEFFIRSFCPEGGSVLDPFCGSGTTLAVAERCGRKYIGIDVRESQVELSRRRVAELENTRT